MERSFADLGITETTIQRLESMGIGRPTPVQQAVIPLVADGKNVLFEAETGSGKTYAYALPLIERLSTRPPKETPAVCVVSPTHELASQIKKMLEAAGGFKIPLLIGGVSVKRQIESLKGGNPVVVGTPARLIELVRLKKLKTSGIFALVLDEADRLFSKELIEPVSDVISSVARGAQFVASSATMGKKDEERFAAFARDFRTARIEKYGILRNHIEHQALLSEERDKITTLLKYLRAESPAKALIFCARLDFVDKVFSALTAKKIPCASIHSKEAKQARKGAIDAFRSGKIAALVASDISARGLDIPDITHIIQMDLPSAEAFVHRAGRTARAVFKGDGGSGKKGIDMVIGNAWEMREFARLEKQLGIVVYPKALYEGRLCRADDGDEPEPIPRERGSAPKTRLSQG